MCMPTRDEVVRLILDELLRTKRRWRGNPVPIALQQFAINEDLRAQVQSQGEQHGCHTCLSIVGDDDNQPWVGDHIPPTGLSDDVKVQAMGRSWDGKTYLFPSCHECSHEQANLVQRLNTGQTGYTSLNASQKQLINGGRPRRTSQCFETTGISVSAAEGVHVQSLGVQHGCHACGTDYPVTTYHADHSFPQEFCTSYMEKVFRHLEIKYPTTFDLRPQCPRCSAAQGGRLKEAAGKIARYARSVGITVYKG